MVVCRRCQNQGIYQGCYCTWNDDMCNNCDGTGYIECPFVEESWHD